MPVGQRPADRTEEIADRERRRGAVRASGDTAPHPAWLTVKTTVQQTTHTILWKILTFAVGTAISMALLSTAFGYALASGPIERNFERLAPVLGVLAAIFGVWYAAGALGVVTYPF
jgi:hypothetical protein